MRGHLIRSRLFIPLAESLAQQDWTVPDIRHHLKQRLPGGLHGCADGIARNLKARFPASAAPDAARIARCLETLPQTAPLVRHVQTTGLCPRAPIDPPRFRPVAKLADLGLPKLSTPGDLAEWLSLDLRQLTRFADPRGLSARADNTFAPHYRHHLMKKPNGDLRLLEEPKPALKHLQRRILGGIVNRVPVHPAAFGFCAGRNCLQGAARHAGEEVVMCFDLRGFFASIAVHRVYGLFRSFGYPAAVAHGLAGLCTAITPAPVLACDGLADRTALANRHLPQGAPTSPALANLTAFPLDVRLAGLARSLEANYTRYADDLTFSGPRRIAGPLRRTVPEIVKDCGFGLNPAKTRMQPASHRQVVTGIVVNQHLNLPRAEYDRLKAVVHRLGDPRDPRRANGAFVMRLVGQITWLEQVNPPKGAKLRERLARALTPAGD